MTFLKTALGLSAFTLLSLHVPSAVAAPAPLSDPFVIDTFKDLNRNDLGVWHGGEEGMRMEYGPGYVRLMPEIVDMSYHTQLAQGCHDLTPFVEKGMYIHVSFAGTDKFTISLNQNNDECSSGRSPSPETQDSVEAWRYVAEPQDIYVPLSHFNINMGFAQSIEFSGFYTLEHIQIFKVEITSKKPEGWHEPEKLPTGTLVLRCKRPNSFAFGIDDGIPGLAQEVMDIVEQEGILVTFFTVGNGLIDPTANFTEVYKEMLRRGHQIALHSYSHPRVEGLATTEEIDFEFRENIRVLKEQLGVESRYFRPPYGVVGARSRQRLASILPDPYIINWSVDVEDWLWADGDTPERQLQAFKRDLSMGGDLAVMHYLRSSTVQYFREFFALVKNTGKDIMRVDQCMEDPDAPPYVSQRVSQQG